MAKCKLTTETHHMVTFSIKFLSCQGEGGGWLKGREGGTLQQYKEKRRENEDGNLKFNINTMHKGESSLSVVTAIVYQ